MSQQSQSTALLTPEEADLLPDATAYELEDGVLKEREMSAESVAIAFHLAVLLANYSATAGGLAQGDGLALRLWPERPRRFVRPDGCYFSPGTMTRADMPRSGIITVAPAVVVEVISPNDNFSEVDRKAVEYLEAGVKAVWLISPDTRRVLIARSDRPIEVYADGAQIVDQPELPGFTCDVTGLMPPRH